MLTAQQLVDILNARLLSMSYQFDTPFLYAYKTYTQIQQLRALIATSIFFYNTSTGKLELKFGIGQPAVNLWAEINNGNTPNDLNGLPDCRGQGNYAIDGFNPASIGEGIRYPILETIRVEMMTMETDSAATQKAVARLLGLTQGFKLARFFGTLVADAGQVPLYHDIFEFNADARPQIQLSQQKIVNEAIKQLTEGDEQVGSEYAQSYNIANRTYGIAYDQAGVLSASLPLPMITSRYELIKVHTSLSTSKWNIDGTQSDVLETIAVTSDQLSMGQEMRNITRIYQTKDPNMRTFTIDFKDVYGNYVDFQTPYTIQIAWFFTK